MTSQSITVAIDGPAGAGKSTVAKEVARRLGFSLVDTGAIYRSVTLLALRNQIALDDDAQLENIVRNLHIEFRFANGVNRVTLRGEDVTDAIRNPEVSRGSSKVSARPNVRAGLLALQRQLAGEGGAVLEGRDIGTVVCPNAKVKIFLSATQEARALRRYKELVERGETTNYEHVLQDLVARDEQDTARAHAPLKAAADALILDSTQMSVEQVITTIVDAVQRAR